MFSNIFERREADDDNANENEDVTSMSRSSHQVNCVDEGTDMCIRPEFV